jgi:hypothetical protein
MGRTDRNKKVWVLAICLVLVLLVPVIVMAQAHGEYKGYRIVKLVIDGKEITPDVPAIIMDGRTLVPVRIISETLGADVDWDPNTYTVTITSSQAKESQKETAKGEDKGIAAGGGFYYKNVSFKSSYIGTEMIGEMSNFSGKDYSSVMFAVSVYDADEKLLATDYAIIANFPNGSTKSFTVLFIDDLPSTIKYKIQYELGY